MKKDKMNIIGKWLSLVEHSVRDAGVGGSNPLFPTIYRARNFDLLVEIPFFNTGLDPGRYLEKCKLCFCILL